VTTLPALTVRFKLAGETAVKKVASVYDTVEKILG
jgi:hypothetical protein